MKTPSCLAAWLSAGIAFAPTASLAQGVDVPGVHIGPGGIVVQKDGRTTVIKKGGISTAGGSARPHPATVPPTGRVLQISAGHQNRTYVCTDSDIQLSGSGNTLTFRGTVRSLQVSGSHNRLRVGGTVRSVALTGSGNTVTWAKQGPHGTPVTDTGSDNSAAFKP